MKRLIKLRWGLSAAALVNLPALLPLSAVGCSGVCGACGGSCAIAALTTGGLLAAGHYQRLLVRRRSQPDLSPRTGGPPDIEPHSSA
ncbi:MAG: hypothetical protein E6X17_13665 [Sporomusaceae bacterium]|nr:hypothetical protein [Sporomusaceae bacterium]